MSFKHQALQHIVETKKQKNKQHIHDTHLFQKAVNIIFTMKSTPTPKPYPQMSAHKGFKLYRELAVAAIMKEFKQLVHGAFLGKPVVEAIKHSNPNPNPKDVDVVTNEMKKMSQHFGDLSIQRGDDFEFLGMNFFIDRENKNIQISMKYLLVKNFLLGV